MPLTFVLGLPGSGKTTYCLNAASEYLQLQNSSAGGLNLVQPAFYIVPEQSTLQAERMLVERSFGKAVMGVQALSFGRLAFYVFARLGGAPTKQLNDVGKHMLLRKILQECNLEFYAKAIKMPGFIENLAHTVTEFSQHMVSPAELEVHAKRMSTETTLKLTDLAEIYRRYRESIAKRYLVTGETLDLLSETLADSDFLRDGLLWIDGFKDFTPQELMVISRILAKAKEVTITLTMDKNSSFSQSDFFYATKRTLHKLQKTAEYLSVPVKSTIFLSELPRFANKELAHLATAFPGPLKPRDSADQSIKVLGVRDKVTELTQAAEWISKNVILEKRWRFRDIAILCGDLPGYEKLARNIFAPYGIPLFIDSKMGILSHPLTELIRAAIDVAVWDWQYEGVFRLLKTGFTLLTVEEIDRLENYVLARGIKSWRWRIKWSDPEMEDIRLRTLEMTSPFLEGISPTVEATVSVFSRRIYSWLYAIKAPDILSLLLAESIESGDQEQARRHRQIWPGIAEIFDKLVEILGSDKVNVKTFGEILDAGLKSADMGLIPPSLDQVVIGDINRSRYPEIKALWVLGANDGQLPASIGQSSLITEDERAILRGSGMQLAPDLSRQMSDNLLALYGALCQPSEALTLSYSKVNANGKPLRPSTVLARISKLLPNPAVFEESLQQENHEPSVSSPTPLYLKEESVELLYGDLVHTAASRLEAYARCPFAYFLDYNLNVRERAIYQVRAVDLGIFYHDVLAKATEELTNNNNWHSVDYDGLEKIVHLYTEAALPGGEDNILRSSARNEYILQRVKSICTVSLWALCEQYRRGSFRTAGIEIKADGIVIPLSPKQQMVVSGRIDRVDILESELGQYLKIIDYKSGSTRFSMDEVQAGTQLQLLLYMNSLLKKAAGKHLPAGVFYFNINDPILPVDRVLESAEREALLLKEFRLTGLALADQLSVSGMDKHLLSRRGESLVIPVSVKKDGGFGKNSSLVSPEEFAQLCLDTEEHVKRIGQQMTKGFIAPNINNKGPMSPCKYCKYGAVCGRG